MTQLTLEQIEDLKKEMPTDPGWIEDRLEEIRQASDGRSAAIKKLNEYYALKELELVNLALRRYGCHD